MAFNYPLSEYKQDWKYSVCTVACKNDKNDPSINQMKASQVIDLIHFCLVITHNISDLLLQHLYNIMISLPFQKTLYRKRSKTKRLLKMIALFLVCSWMILSIPCCSGDNGKKNTSRPIPNLDKLITYLRDDDTRLVRYNVRRWES